MIHKRIKSKPADVLQQLRLVAAGIAGEPDWPTSSAPEPAQVNALAGDLEGNLRDIEQLEAQLSVARARRADLAKAGQQTIRRADQVTSGLYGPDDTRKENFGLPPKLRRAASSAPVGKAVITKVKDGVGPGSIFLNWRSLEDVHAYSVEWYSDSALTQMVGYATATRSDYTIQKLAPGQQYWMRVRGVRGNAIGDWSTATTHTASL